MMLLTTCYRTWMMNENMFLRRPFKKECEGDGMSKEMTQDQRLDFLVGEFKADSVEYKDLEIPKDTEGKRRVLRSLMNIRMSKGLPDNVMEVQDEYLKERAADKGIVELSDIPVIHDGISIWQGDITRLAVDAIVNAANSQMLGCFVPMHTCIDNCIHTYAGIQLREECNRQMDQLRIRYGRDYEQPTAVPMLTDAYNLPAKKVVHIVGPIVQYKLTPALEKDLKMKVYYIKDKGSFAVWKATKASGQYDQKTFEVKARPMEKLDGIRPGMSVILKN